MTKRPNSNRTPLERALAECVAYNQIGKLTYDVICDIAFDFEIEVEELVKAFYD